MNNFNEKLKKKQSDRESIVASENINLDLWKRHAE